MIWKAKEVRRISFLDDFIAVVVAITISIFIAIIACAVFI